MFCTRCILASCGSAIALALIAATVRHAHADAMMVTRAMQASTIAEIFIEGEQIRAEIEVGAADVPAFVNIFPDKLYERLTGHPRPFDERQQTFFDSEWVIQADGRPLRGTLERLVPGKRIVRDEITGEALAEQPADAALVIRLTLRYELAERPRSLTMRPPQSGNAPAANIGFVCYHDGVPVNDFRYMSGEVTLDLDWEDPWYSRFRHRNLRRQYEAPLSVFLYVESFEVRKEIVVRPKDLQQWIDLGLEGKKTISVESQETLKKQVAEFLAKRAPISVDGQPAQGKLDRIHFVRRTLRTTGIVDPPEDLDINTATLGVIFVYPIDQLPQTVSLTWDLFGPRIQKVPAATTDEAGGLPSTVSPDDPELRWQNFLTSPTLPAMMTVTLPEKPTVSVPVISTLCFGLVLALLSISYRKSRSGSRVPNGVIAAGALALLLGVLALPYAQASLPNPMTQRATLETREAKEVLHALLYNVYRAFDRRDESLVYDRLAQSITGDLLTDVYLQVRRSMELENQGGARVKIDDVQLLEVDAEKESTGPGLAYRCRWTAAGSVGHWGHIHRRTNRYDAAITIESVDGVWKISAIDLREEQRVDPAAMK